MAISSAYKFFFASFIILEIVGGGGGCCLWDVFIILKGYLMKKLIFTALCTTFLLTGCQSLQKNYDDVLTQAKTLLNTKPGGAVNPSEKVANATAKNATLTQICNDVSKNSFRAKENWEGKVVQITDVVADINETAPMFDGQPGYVKQATLKFKTKYVSTANLGWCNATAFIDYSELSKYSVGEKVTLKGIVTFGMGDSMKTSVINLTDAKVIGSN